MLGSYFHAFLTSLDRSYIASDTATDDDQILLVYDPLASI
jgi:hypothetical protein